jgi:hypothetical protein
MNELEAGPLGEEARQRLRPPPLLVDGPSKLGLSDAKYYDPAGRCQRPESALALTAEKGAGHSKTSQGEEVMTIRAVAARARSRCPPS